MAAAGACPFISVQGPPVADDSGPAHVDEEGKSRVSRVSYRKSEKVPCFTMEEVKKHKTKDDGWIVVHGKVYDITDHILNHPGWHNAAITTVLSILAHIGSDCTEEFVDIHRPYPIAWNQLKAFYIGELVDV